MSRPSTSALARSSGYAGAAAIWQVVSRIVLTPAILACLGLDGYGTWTLLFTLAGSADVATASFGSAYTRLTAELQARRDFTTLTKLVASGVLVVTALGAIVTIALWLFGSPLLAILGIQAALLPEAHDALMLIAAGTLARMSLGCAQDVLAGLQRTDLRYKASLSGSALYLMLALGTLEAGWGLRGLASAFLAGELMSIGIAWVWCRRLCPGYALRPLSASRDAAYQILQIGGRFQLLQVANRFSNEGSKLLISALMGPATLAVFELAFKLVRLAEAGPRALIEPLMPAFATMHAVEEKPWILETLRSGTRILMAASLTSFGFMAIFPEACLRLWTGQSLPLAAWTFRVLAIGFVAKQLTGVATASLRGRGNVSLELSASLLAGTLRLAFGLALYLVWDYHGFVLGIPLALVLGTLWLIVPVARDSGFSLASLLTSSLFRPFVALLPTLAGIHLLATLPFLDPDLTDSRWALLIHLGSWGVVFGLCATISTWFLVLTRGERSKLLKLTAYRFSPEPGPATNA